MKSLIALALLLAACPTFAQINRSADVFVGYSYVNVDTDNLSSRQSANGWESALSVNLNRYFAVEGDINGAYKNILGVSVSDYFYGGGGRLNLGPSFVHALAGGSDLRGSDFGVTVSQQSFAAAFGGGLQPRLTNHLSVRASADYVMTHHDLAHLLGIPGPSPRQDNFRVGIGIVYTFGGTGYSEPDRPARSSRNSPPATKLADESVLFGIAGVPVAAGVQVTLVRYLSAANRAGIQMGDVVTAISGDQVKTIHDIEVAVGKHVTGSVDVEYLTKGIAKVQNTVTVAPPPGAEQQ